MAGKNTLSRKSPVNSSRKGRTSSRHGNGSLRRLLAFAAPHSSGQLFALLLVLLGIGTLVVAAPNAVLSHGVSWPVLVWSILLFGAAALLSVWIKWRAQLRTVTAEKLRAYTGGFFLIWIALALSWHLLSANLGFGDSYLFPAPFDRAPGAIVSLLLIGALALAFLTRAPVIRWSGALIQTTIRRLEAIRSPQTLEYAHVATLPSMNEHPYLHIEDEPDEPSARQTGKALSNRQRSASPPVPEPLSLTRSTGTLPPVELFAPPPKGPATPTDLEHKSERIQETLASFNVAARVVAVHVGPVVTQFDVQPDRGVKVRKITELQNDLALALAAPTIRIQAPVPGKPVVGIEIPNSAATMVAFREILESDAYRSVKSPLKLALGKDVAGTPAVIDLARMPHLLIAGATGSGKSVLLNVVISCLLTQNLPDQVRLMLVDPKMVELTVYNGVPHLLSPVVTQTDKIVGILQWALREMERRYQLFSQNSVRNIQRYNEKVDVARPSMAASRTNQQKLPYIVLIIDELADLMMVAPEDVEDAICRLAQLARAAGIHLIIATQRPSVDVITGLIKANFPARIAFAMSSQVDSRTILDTVGAEKLLGRGDMLYMPPDAPKPVRLQGAFLSDREIERLVEFWQRSPMQTTVEKVPEEEFAAAEKAASEVEDDLLGEATRLVRDFEHASVSLLQRKLRVGYARAARLMDQLEDKGVVGPPDGSKQRRVLDDERGFTLPSR